MSQTTYIETELGLLPSDWKVVTIGEVGYVITGTTPPTSDVRNYGREYMFVSPADLGHSKYVKRTEKYLSTKGFNLARRLPPDSILYTCIGSTIGKMGVATQELATNQQINAVIPFSGYDADYLYYAINFRRNLIIGDASIQAVPLINKNDFSSKHISVPTDISEQERIAATLTSIDSLIDNLNRTIAKKQNIRQGAMEQLLSGQLRLPRFKKKWDSVYFEDIYKYAKEGGTPSTSNPLYYEPATIPFAKIEDLYSHYLIKTNNHISEEGLNHSSAWIVPTGNILLSNGATLGEVTITGIPVATKQGILGLIIRKDKYDTEYLYYVLKMNDFKKKMEAITTHGTMDCAYLKDLKGIELYIPTDLKEQQAIADTLTAMDDEIAMLQLERDKYANIRAGMMDELLSGKKRLI